MKSPFLVFLLIFNLLAVSTASAMNVYDEELTESHLTQSSNHGDHDHEVDQETALASCIDESSCDHFCHFSSHLVGFVSNLPSIANINNVIQHVSLNQSLRPSFIEPPTRPPQA